MEVLTLALSIIMLVSQSVGLFINEITVDRSPATIRSYRGRLNLLCHAFGDRELSAVTPEDLQAWFASQRIRKDGTEKAPDTIRLTVIAFELWQTWVVKRGDIPAPWLQKMKKPGGRKREQLPTKEEMKLLLEHASPDFVIACRALRLTGARPGELARARIEDINTRDGLIILNQHKTAKKTGKPRKIAIGHPALVEIIEKSTAGRTSGPIFLRGNGRPWTTEALSSEYRRARKAAGLSPDLVLYLCRHEHGTQLYEATGDLKAVADSLGHTQLNTTMRYTRATAEMLKRNQHHFSEGVELTGLSQPVARM